MYCFSQSSRIFLTELSDFIKPLQTYHPLSAGGSLVSRSKFLSLQWNIVLFSALFF